MRALLSVAAAAATGAAAASDSASVVVTTNVLQKRPVSRRFVGFSIEVGSTPAVFALGGLGGPPRASFPNLMNLLRTAAGSDVGPNIRVGGNSADESVYLPPSTPLPTNDTYRISDADLALYAAAVSRWAGTITLDVNLRNPTDPSLAVAHLTAALDPSRGGLVWGKSLEGVEIGNEVDLFFENGIRAPDYDYKKYRGEFGTYAAAVAPLFPPGGGGKIQGATWCSSHWIAEGTGNWSDYISRYGPAGTNSMNSLSYHHYPETACNGRKPTLAGLMADASSYGIANATAPLAAVADAAGIPMYIAEGNSVSCGGYSGVSDVFGSALWSVDTLLAMAAAGLQRWNFHGMPGGPYSAITYPTVTSDTPVVRPLFYGLWAFATATRHDAVVYETHVKSTNELIKGWALRDGAGAWRVVLLHKDPSADAPASATVSVTPPVALTGAATLTRLSGGDRGINATDTDPITFGGLTFLGTVDGTPVGPPATESVPVGADGSYMVTLPRGSGAILELPAA